MTSYSQRSSGPKGNEAIGHFETWLWFYMRMQTTEFYFFNLNVLRGKGELCYI